MIHNLLLIAAVQGFFVSAFVLIHRKFRNSPARCLGWLTLVISLNLLQPLLHHDDGSVPYFLRYLNVPWFFFFMPFLFMFLEKYTQKIDQSKKYFTLAIFLFFVNISISLYWLIQNLDTHILQSHLWKLRTINETIGVIFSVFIWWKMNIYFKENKHFYPIPIQIWFRNSLIILIITFGIWLAAILSNYYLRYQHPFTFDSFYQILRLTVGILIYWIFYVGIFKVILTRPLAKTLQKKIPEDDSHLKKIESEELFTDPYLNVDTLAEKLGITTSHLRLLIKTKHNSSFSEYINRLRVEKAKKLLSDPNFDHYTLQAIGEDAGFNSRSTFYRCFKKITGLTPKAFREQLSRNI